MKKEYIVKLTTLTRNVRYLVSVDIMRRSITTADVEQAKVFKRKADINEMFRSMSHSYRNLNWEIIAK